VGREPGYETSTVARIVARTEISLNPTLTELFWNVPIDLPKDEQSIFNCGKAAVSLNWPFTSVGLYWVQDKNI